MTFSIVTHSKFNHIGLKFKLSAAFSPIPCYLVTLLQVKFPALGPTTKSALQVLSWANSGHLVLHTVIRSQLRRFQILVYRRTIAYGGHPFIPFFSVCGTKTTGKVNMFLVLKGSIITVWTILQAYASTVYLCMSHLRVFNWCLMVFNWKVLN